MAAAIGGLADTHAAAVSIATLVATEKLSASDAEISILAAFSINMLGKMLAAAKAVIPALVVVGIPAWIASLNQWRIDGSFTQTAGERRY